MASQQKAEARVQQTLQHLSIIPGAKFLDEMKATAKAIATRGKGILAADESTPTIGKRFQEISVDNNEVNRRDYRDLLFRTKGVGQYISGCILYEETLNQKAADGTTMVDLLKAEGIIPGIKVDKGTANIPGTDDETATFGLDGLDKRCAEYYKKGARFAKWRAVLKISNNCPSDLAIAENAHGLARYGAICQEHGLVPIIEPEILMDGDHSIEVTAAVMQKVWEVTIKELHDNGLVFEALLLKPSMVLPGSGNKTPYTPEDVAIQTVHVLQRTIPPAIPGIMFLSGGQSEEEATLNLNAMNKLDTVKPWALSFSYGRALQHSILKAWKGKKENVAQAQQVFIERAKANSLAQLGKYVASGASGTAGQKLFVTDYKY